MNARRAALAGVIGTAAMTALWLVEPSVGLPKIAIGQLLSTAMSVSVARASAGPAAGWVVHVIVGSVLALIYAATFARWLSGPPGVRGATYGAIVFVVAQIAFMPLVGAGFFSHGDVELIAGSLLGHVVYGSVVGWIYELGSPGDDPVVGVAST